MNKFPWMAGEIKIYGLYGALVRAWVATRRRSYSGINFRSTAPHGRRRGWPDVGGAYARSGLETATFFEAFAGAVENACKNPGGIVDVVSDYADSRLEVGIHDDAWTPSQSHNARPATDMVAKLAADDGLRLVAIRSWHRTVSENADRMHYARNPVLCVFETQQAELFAESLRRFAKM